MTKEEYEAMVKLGTVQESHTGTKHVANPADMDAFGKQAKPDTFMWSSMFLLHL